MVGTRTRTVAAETASRWLDPALGVGFVVLSLATIAQAPDAMGTLPLPAAIALAVVTSVPLVVRRRWPLVVLAITGLGVLVGSAFGASLNLGGFALLVAVFTIAAESDRRRALAVLVGLPLYLLLAATLYELVRGGTLPEAIGSFASGLAIFGAVWFAGDSVRARRLRTRVLEERAARLERERDEAARIAIQNERAQIARELHDVVAHSVSVMTVQAAAARRVLDEQPAAAKEALASIEATGRDALTEMRRLLGILRTDGDPAPLEPSRGLGGLGALISRAGASGVKVELSIEGQPRPLPAGLDLAAYRIVQEALTNTIKHAGRARAAVRLRYEAERIAIEVADEGPAPGAAGDRGASPGAGDGVQGRGAPGTGHGLIGMAERVHLYGGTFRAGPRPGGGFGVEASLPLDGAPA